MSEPAYRRLDVDERRQQLLERGAELFTSHPYDELSMSQIATEVGISKALLYHYFPSKQAYFEATLSAWAEQLRERTEPDPDLPPVEQLTEQPRRLPLPGRGERGRLPQPDAQRRRRARDPRADRSGAAGDGASGSSPGSTQAEPPPKARIAVSGWLWFMDGACLNWVEHRDIEREELRDLLLGVLMGALIATGAPPDPAQVSLTRAADTAPSCVGGGSCSTMLVCALVCGALLGSAAPAAAAVPRGDAAARRPRRRPALGPAGGEGDDRGSQPDPPPALRLGRRPPQLELARL